MSGTVLTTAAILSLLTGPECGRLLPPGDLADRITAHVVRESAGDPFAIGVNPDRVRGLPQYSIHPRSVAEAVQTARSLAAQGRTFGLGLVQIDTSQLARHRLSFEAAFDQCQSLRAGIEHYSADLNAAAIYRLASMRYNTGSFERGEAYARGVEIAAERVKRETAPTATGGGFTPSFPQPEPLIMVNALRSGGPPVPVMLDGTVNSVIHKRR